MTGAARWITAGLTICGGNGHRGGVVAAEGFRQHPRRRSGLLRGDLLLDAGDLDDLLDHLLGREPGGQHDGADRCAMRKEGDCRRYQASSCPLGVGDRNSREVGTRTGGGAGNAADPPGAHRRRAGSSPVDRDLIGHWAVRPPERFPRPLWPRGAVTVQLPVG